MIRIFILNAKVYLQLNLYLWALCMSVVTVLLGATLNSVVCWIYFLFCLLTFPRMLVKCRQCAGCDSLVCTSVGRFHLPDEIPDSPQWWRRHKRPSHHCSPPRQTLSETTHADTQQQKYVVIQGSSCSKHTSETSKKQPAEFWSVSLLQI